jgi:TonB family protein
MMVLVDETTMERMTAVATDPSAAAPPATKLSAEPAEGQGRARASSSLTGVNRWIALGAALLLHLAIFTPVWLQFDWAPKAAPPSEEIPVEIVVEPPKPPPQPQPQPSSEPAPPKPPIDLSPAYDAPRGAASDDKTPRFGDSAAKNAEKAAPPDQPQSGEKAAATDAAKPAEAISDQQAAVKDDGGPQKASEDAPTLPDSPAEAAVAPAAQAKVATMIGQPLPTWSKSKQFSTFEPVPDVQFGDAAKSPVGGGTESTTYNSVAVGLIRSHVRLTNATALGAKHLQLKIVFDVDGHGAVIDRSLVEPSGSSEFDAAIMEAVKEAGPFAPPPMGLPIRLTLTYGLDDNSRP